MIPAEPLDPSWVPATVATCSATLIAIVGGLVATRRVAVETDLRKAEATVKTMMKAQDIADEAVATAKDDLDDTEAHVWIARSAEYLVKTDRQSIAADTVRTSGPVGSAPSQTNSKKLQPYVDDGCRRVSQAMASFHARFRDAVRMPDTWELARAEMVAVANDGLDEVIYSRVYAAKYAEWLRGQPPGPVAAREGDADGLPAGAAADSAARIPDLPPAETTALRGKPSLLAVRAAYEAALADQRVARTQLRIARVNAQSVEQPGGDRKLFASLTVLGLLGVVAPLAMLTIGMQRVPHYLDWALVGVVTVGIPVILAGLVGRLRWPWSKAAKAAKTANAARSASAPSPPESVSTGDPAGVVVSLGTAETKDKPHTHEAPEND